MSLTGEDKEMRMPGSLGYHSLDQNLDQSANHHHTNHVQPLDHHQDPKPSGDNNGGATPQPLMSALSIDKGSKSKTVRARYRECLKNHAANIGGNVTDGCGEFMPSGDDGTLEALKCAACNCHRNFHRKEPPNGGSATAMIVHPLQLPPPSINHQHRSLWSSISAQPVKIAFGPAAGPAAAAGGGGGGVSAGTDSSSEELNFNFNTYQQASSVAQPNQPPFVTGKKRFRTKFTAEQKDKMLEFAEKLGWRIPREDDSEVQRFCSQVGVKRQVFKVWMHNNKNPSAVKKNTLQEDQS